MKKLLPIFAIGLLIFAASTTAFAQKKAPAYKIAGITITPFNEASGKFEGVIGNGQNGRSLFNDLSLSLFVTVDVEGEAGSFEAGRMLTITVKEGKKIKTTRKVQVGLIGEGGHYYTPVWLYPAMCEDVTITATLSGQTKPSTMKRIVTANCGE